MLKDIKLLLGTDNNDSDAVLELMIRDAVQAVLNYCHIPSLPMALEPVVRSTVISAFNYQNEGNIASIKRGDTQITYTQPIGIEDFTFQQKHSLNAYRKWRKK